MSKISNILVFSVLLMLVSSPVTGQDERTGYWWNKRFDSDKLSYVAGFADGMGFATSIVGPLIQLSLNPESLESKTRTEIIKLYKHWADGFVETVTCLKEVTGDELKEDLDEYYEFHGNREIPIMDAVRILEIEPRIVRDEILEYRIKELERLSEKDKRYEYLKQKYLKEKALREEKKEIHND